MPKYLNKTLQYIHVEGEKHCVFCLFKYKKKGIIQVLIHQLKYNKKKYIGEYLGERLYPIVKPLREINYIIPVPLTKQKKKIRGYNQSEVIARGLTKLLECKILTTVLLRNENKQSQTLKSRYQRFDEIEGAFSLSKGEILENKHILLLDDVYTTGATISECIKALNKIKNIEISVVCIAS